MYVHKLTACCSVCNQHAALDVGQSDLMFDAKLAQHFESMIDVRVVCAHRTRLACSDGLKIFVGSKQIRIETCYNVKPMQFLFSTIFVIVNK